MSNYNRMRKFALCQLHIVSILQPSGVNISKYKGNTKHEYSRECQVLILNFVFNVF